MSNSNESNKFSTPAYTSTPGTPTLAPTPPPEQLFDVDAKLDDAQSDSRSDPNEKYSSNGYTQSDGKKLDNILKLDNEKLDLEKQQRLHEDETVSNSNSNDDDIQGVPTKVEGGLLESDGEIRVVLEPSDDPKQLPLWRKWLAVLVISSGALCVACGSSTAGFAEEGESLEFHVSREVTILGISIFVAGLGMGPLLQGPLSEFYGRNAIYWGSYATYWLFTWPVAFAPNIAVYLIFRFLCGFCGAAFLSVAGGSVSDLFTNQTVATPMAIYTISPFAGPVLGPVLAGFINQNAYWRWTYRFQLIWQVGEFLALIFFVPETYEPIILKWKAIRLRKETGNTKYYAPIERSDRGLLHAIVVSCYRPFQLMISERMAMLLDLWNALMLGILYLAFQAFPIIFEDGHAFTIEQTGLSFLGIGLGMVLAILSQPIWNHVNRTQYIKYDNHPPPEMRLLMGMPGGILATIGLFILAFTTYPNVHWIAPILGSIPFGTGVIYIFTATFSYLVTAYRPYAASAMAGNSFLRSSFAAGFPLFAPAMYEKLGTVGATALLAGLSALMAPFPFIFYKYGHRIRGNSKYAVDD